MGKGKGGGGGGGGGGQEVSERLNKTYPFQIFCFFSSLLCYPR